MTQELPDKLTVSVYEAQEYLNGHGGNASAPPAAETSMKDGPKFPLTDLGNAERLVHRFGEDILFVKPWERWMQWDGSRWKNDVTGGISRQAKLIARSIYDEAKAIVDADRRQEVWKHAIRSENGQRIRELIRLAQTEDLVAAEPEIFDAKPMLVTCLNGTIDLETGRLRSHARQDKITRSLSVAYVPDARAPHWLAFLHRVMDGNEQLIAFLQRAAGYSLTGLTIEQILFLLYGTGRNGKSVFINVIQHIMGDYARSARPEMLMVKQGSDIPNEVAALAGVRFVPTVEIEDGTRLAESLVKQLTGGDKISARFLRAEFFEFVPAMKIWMVGNHKPIIRGTDVAIWERILTIPFTVTIPEEERDKHLTRKLQAEGQGILAWMVEGCLIWQRSGLDPPPDVRAATEEYRTEMDVLAQFLEDCCEERYEAVTPASQLYERYATWCKAMGERQWSQQTFGRRLKERGFESDRSKHLRVWQGIDLKGDAGDAGDTYAHR